MDYATYQLSLPACQSHCRGAEQLSLWNLPFSASPPHHHHHPFTYSPPKTLSCHLFDIFYPLIVACMWSLHVILAVTLLTWREKNKNDVELKRPVLSSGQRQFAPGLYPGPLSVMNASDPSTCLRLWLVEQSSMFRLTGLQPPLRSVCTSSACLAEWVAIRKGQNLWLKMLCKNMLSLT